MNNKRQLNFAGEIIKLGLSALLAGYLAKKLVNKYPGDEMPNFAKSVGSIILIFSVTVLSVLIVMTFIYGFYDLLTPDPESMIQAAQRRLKQRGG